MLNKLILKKQKEPVLDAQGRNRERQRRKRVTKRKNRSSEHNKSKSQVRVLSDLCGLSPVP